MVVSGLPGTGKSLLGNLLFSSGVSSRVNTDCKGVGRYDVAEGRHLLKLDEASTEYFTSKEDMSTYMAMYESEWCSKIHGGRAINAPCTMYVTTNIMDPEIFFTNDGNFVIIA